MKAYLRLISLFLLLYQLPCQADSIDADSAVIRQYNLLLQVRGNDISGICVMKIVSPTEIIGTVINEFGLTVLDFEYKGGKTKLSNLPPLLDKWYIRKIFKKDLSFFLSNILLQQNTKKRSRELIFSPDGEMILTNNRFKIKYTFTPIKDEE